MKIRLIVVGKTEQRWIEEGLKNYFDRIGQYISFDYVIIPEVKLTGKPDPDRVRKAEGDAIMRKIDSNDHVILLDERGSQYTSEELADFLQKLMNQSLKQVVFIVGGAWGFHEEVYHRARSMVSLSRMTFNHQLVRLIFAEQLYRAFTILRGEPYHHR
ncbi:MAG: 23S rRNA (pseudouridine(1915)-N(3))-methyltransferase RlmH [Bacteroidales bacterium]|nr:23S rRNA (pseudouridine(1915)-N(3))-methyltransferase RlmH [Bacteroidales bacterium]